MIWLLYIDDYRLSSAAFAYSMRVKGLYVQRSQRFYVTLGRQRLSWPRLRQSAPSIEWDGPHRPDSIHRSASATKIYRR